jgi:hypothetical protein
VVFAVVALFRASGGDARFGFLWYVPAVLASWALGALVARVYSIPCERELRERLGGARGRRAEAPAAADADAPLPTQSPRSESPG